jgi:hypothetical protein
MGFGIMDKIIRHAHDLGGAFSLSPEHWLSFSSANTLTVGVCLADIVDLHKKGTAKINETAFVLDTGHSDRGLFILPFRSESDRTKRVSNKKIVPNGAVLISRLRPYLQQVVYVPHNATELLGVDEILCSTEYYVLVAKNKNESIAYLVPWLLSKEVQSVFDQATTGGHHPRFNDELLFRLFVSNEIIDCKHEVSRQVEALVVDHLICQKKMADIVEQTKN